jgi:hypothetical protein
MHSLLARKQSIAGVSIRRAPSLDRNTPTFGLVLPALFVPAASYAKRRLAG